MPQRKKSYIQQKQEAAAGYLKSKGVVTGHIPTEIHDGQTRRTFDVRVFCCTRRAPSERPRRRGIAIIAPETCRLNCHGTLVVIVHFGILVAASLASTTGCFLLLYLTFAPGPIRAVTFPRLDPPDEELQERHRRSDGGHPW